MSDDVIRHLRHKIVLVSLVAVLLSLAALVFAINYAHYLQTDAGLRSAMNEIASNLDAKGDLEQRVGTQDRAQRGEQSDLATDGATHGEAVREEALPEGSRQDAGPDDMGRSRHDDRRSARTQYGSRFFCVMVGSDGSMFVRAKGNSELSNDSACELAQRALESGRADGLLDDYKFAVEKTDGQTRILFLDCTTDLQSLGQLLVVSLVVGGCALVVASLFVYGFSGLVIRPLEESTRKQKQFVSDAGHELKTPLSVIATNMDILEADLEDKPEEREWIDSTNRQVNNMRRLVNDLIVLSKMEEQQTADLVLTEVSLSDIAYECVLTFEQLAHTQGKEMRASIEDGVCVTADEPSVRQLMQILVDNAIKYATGDGVVLVEVRREGRGAAFATRNQWDHGVDAQELSTLFDRFVRGERSRDRSSGESGYGLGLSIARAIAQKNRAKLNVSEDDEGRIVFRAMF